MICSTDDLDCLLNYLLFGSNSYLAELWLRKSLKSGYTEMDGDFVATCWREFSRDNDQNGQRLANFVEH